MLLNINSKNYMCNNYEKKLNLILKKIKFE